MTVILMTFYDEYLQILKNKKDAISFQRGIDRLGKKLAISETDFKRVISHLYPNMRLFLYDSNICVYYPHYNEAALFSPCNFNETVFVYDKQKEYLYIKDYILTTCKLFDKLSNIDSSLYQQMLQFVATPPVKRCNTERIENIKAYPEDYVVRFLYNLTCGDIKTLYDFGRVCGQMMFRKNNRPAVVLAHSCIHQELKKFFEGLESKSYEFDIKTMALRKEIERLFYLNLNHHQERVLIICTGGEIPTAKSVRDKLYSLMKGKTLTTTHPYFNDKLRITNQLPIIFITDSHEQYITMKNEFNAIGVKLPCTSAAELKYKYSPWYSKIFSCMGIGWLETKRSNGSGLFKATSDDVIKSFIKDVCIISDEAICDKSELYSAYKYYCEKRFGVMPLTRKAFSTRFALYGDFSTVRIHRETKISPYYFKGITFDKEKFQDSLDICEKYFSTYEKFETKLKKCIVNEKNRLQKIEDEKKKLQVEQCDT